MEQMETAQRLAGCSFGVNGVPFWGKLRASMQQMETAHRLFGCFLGINSVRRSRRLRCKGLLIVRDGDGGVVSRR